MELIPWLTPLVRGACGVNEALHLWIHTANTVGGELAQRPPYTRTAKVWINNPLIYLWCVFAVMKYRPNLHISFSQLAIVVGGHVRIHPGIFTGCGKAAGN